MRINRFEDLKAWQAARDLVRLMDQVTGRKEFQSDPSLRKQIQDASASSQPNISEGFESGSDAEFARFLKISKRSAGEVQGHLYIAKDRRLISRRDFDTGYDQCRHVMRLTGGLIRYLTRPRKPPSPPSNGRGSRPGKHS